MQGHFCCYIVEEDQAVQPDPDYPFVQEDSANGHLVQLHDTVPNFARYVGMQIINEQTTPLGIAADVTVEMRLLFGVVDNVTPYPYQLDRVVKAPVIGAGKLVSGRVFNVAGLLNYTIVVRKVTYQDVSGTKRSAGYGVGRVYRRIGQQPLYVSPAFKPARREIVK